MPRHAAGTPADPGKPAAGRHLKPGQDKRDVRQIRQATAAASAVTSKRTAAGKPSVVGHATAGATAGAALGGIVGSVFPGVGTVAGTVAGGAIGGTTGAVGGVKAKRQARLAARDAGQRALVAEFVACALILALSPLTDKHKTDTPADWLKRATGICALFMILGLAGSAGPRASRTAAAFGGLVLVTLLVSDRDVLTKIAARFGATVDSAPAGPPGTSGGTGSENLPGVPDSGSRPTTGKPVYSI